MVWQGEGRTGGSVVAGSFPQRAALAAERSETKRWESKVTDSAKPTLLFVFLQPPVASNAHDHAHPSGRTAACGSRHALAARCAGPAGWIG